MTAKLWLAALTVLLVGTAPARAAPAEFLTTDLHGRPLSEVVVELAPVRAVAGRPASAIPLEGIIDQRHETFLPLVTLVRQGGRVIFTNHDSTMHQVYSFSPTKQFAFEIDEGQRSQPVVFDIPGIAAIGCNIHDQMITYVYVAAEPWAAVSDAAGLASVADVPPGIYRGQFWHPQLPPGARLPTFAFTQTSAGGKIALSLPVVVGPAVKKSTHMQMY